MSRFSVRPSQKPSPAMPTELEDDLDDISYESLQEQEPFKKKRSSEGSHGRAASGKSGLGETCTSLSFACHAKNTAGAGSIVVMALR